MSRFNIAMFRKSLKSKEIFCFHANFLAGLSGEFRADKRKHFWRNSFFSSSPQSPTGGHKLSYIFNDILPVLICSRQEDVCSYSFKIHTVLLSKQLVVLYHVSIFCQYPTKKPAIAGGFSYWQSVKPEKRKGPAQMLLAGAFLLGAMLYREIRCRTGTIIEVSVKPDEFSLWLRNITNGHHTAGLNIDRTTDPNHFE